MASPTQAKELCLLSPETFIENIAVRQNGHLLLSTFEQSKLYGLDPSTPNPTPTVIATFPGVDAITGIAEVAPDVFAIGGGVKGAIFRFQGDMSVFTVTLAPDGSATTKLIASVPGSGDAGGMLNGMTSLPGKRHVVLGADSLTGEIHRVDTQTGAVDVAFGDAALQMDPEDKVRVPVGVNGIRAIGKHLYFANSQKGLFGRFPISVDGDKVGDVEIVAEFEGTITMGSAFDDFAVTQDESVAYIGTHPNRVTKVDIKTGKQEVLLESNADVAVRAPTSAALSKDEKVLYVSTGGMAMADGKMERIGAQVIQISLE